MASAASLASTSVTGKPASARLMAMRLPMVPAPTTPAVCSARGAIPEGTPGTRAACRSAKNRWRSARDSGDATQAASKPASTASPSANGKVAAACTACTMAAAAG